MAYLNNSTHYNNWIFTSEELARIDRLRHLKAKKALREEREQLTAAAANGSIGMKPVRKPRSFASLLPASTTATRDINDWNDAVDIDIEVEEQGEEKLGLHVTPLIEYLSLDQEKLMREFYEAKVQESARSSSAPRTKSSAAR
jgi:cyclin H